MKSKINFQIYQIIPGILFSVIFALAGCGGSDSVVRQLDIAESLMESRPDSALIILDSLQVSDLNGKSEKARYALLKSMAIDKSYIDTTTFDVLQPAIDYYIENGIPDEKLRTYYYQGRIYQNRNERDSALRSFIRGLDIADECNDSLTIARMLVAQAAGYVDFYDFNASSENYLRAAEIYRSKSLHYLEFDCLTSALDCMIILNKKERSDSLIKVLDKFHPLDETQEQLLHDLHIIYIYKFGSDHELRQIVERKQDSLTYDVNGILNLARVYGKLGDNDMAIRQLAYLDDIKADYDTLKYLSIKFPILENQRKYEEALAVYKDYINRLEAANSRKFMHINRTMEDKHQLELQAEREARKHARILWLCIGSIMFLVMGILMLGLFNRRNKAMKDLALQTARTAELENENLVQRVATFESESEDLKELLESQKEMPEEVRKAIRTRVEMLNSYLASRISDHKEFEKVYDEWVAGLTADTQAFMDSNRLAFQASHPEFIKYFEEQGLTDSEINYVCLYAIGLRGKDVGNYMRMRSHVNISSAIRKKLGIDRHETNIGIYVRKKLQEF